MLLYSVTISPHFELCQRNEQSPVEPHASITAFTLYTHVILYQSRDSRLLIPYYYSAASNLCDLNVGAVQHEWAICTASYSYIQIILYIQYVLLLQQHAHKCIGVGIGGSGGP